jgi:ribonuclease-3
MKILTRQDVENIVKFKIDDLSIYQIAFVHKSASKQFESSSSERLEFIGDSVLGMIVAEYLYKKYPHENEGFMTKIRTKLVSGKALAKFGEILDIDKFILMNDKAIQQEWNKNARIVEDAMEALIGAIYLDLGLEKAKKFVIEMIETHVDDNILLIDTNYKDQLMKYAQSKNLGLPEYKIIDQTGPDHHKYFTVQVMIQGKKISEGKDKNKKTAEQASALRALKTLGYN